MEVDWGNAKERCNAVGAERGSWNLQGEKKETGNRRENWKGCHHPEANQHVAERDTGAEKGNLVKNWTRSREKKL